MSFALRRGLLIQIRYLEQQRNARAIKPVPGCAHFER